MTRLARLLDTGLPILASIAFAIVWIYVALAVFTDSTLPTDTWSWLQGLELIPAVIAWLALLPLGVFLWAWDAELDTIWFGLVMVLLVGWTWLAWAGMARALLRRGRRS